MTSPRLRRHPRVHGSIGTQALDVISRNPERFVVAALSAGGNIDLLAQQAVATRALLVAVASASREEVTTAIGASRAGRPPRII